jgi:hypothetical protein
MPARPRIRRIWMMSPPCAKGLLVALMLPIAGPSSVLAREPYLSIRTGLRCSQCHVNRTGGGGRNDFGSFYAQTRLPMGSTAFRERSLSRVLAVGVDLRTVASYMVNAATPRSSVSLLEANLQVEFRLIPDKLAVYVDETLGPAGAYTREGFALLHRLPLDGHLKVGQFFLPFGWRLVDDAEFIRQRTGFTYATPDQGVEVGIEPGPLSLFVAVSNGTQGAPETNTGKQVTGTAALSWRPLRIGTSASRNDGSAGRRDVIGGFGGVTAGRLTVLGELDFIRDQPATGPVVEQTVVYLEGNLLVRRGVNLKGTFGFLDPDRSIGENARNRARFGIEMFPRSFLQLSAFYVLLQDIPQATTDRDRLVIELHAFF